MRRRMRQATLQHAAAAQSDGTRQAALQHATGETATASAHVAAPAQGGRLKSFWIAHSATQATRRRCAFAHPRTRSRAYAHKRLGVNAHTCAHTQARCTTFCVLSVARPHAQGRILSVDDDEINHATIKVRSPR
jgi:hypothetical protein